MKEKVRGTDTIRKFKSNSLSTWSNREKLNVGHLDNIPFAYWVHQYCYRLLDIHRKLKQIGILIQIQIYLINSEA